MEQFQEENQRLKLLCPLSSSISISVVFDQVDHYIGDVMAHAKITLLIGISLNTSHAAEVEKDNNAVRRREGETFPK